VLGNVSSSAAAVVQVDAGQQPRRKAGSEDTPDRFCTANQSLHVQHQLHLPGSVCAVNSALESFKQQLRMQLHTPLPAAPAAAALSPSSTTRDAAGSSPLSGNTICGADEQRLTNSSAACRNSTACADQSSMADAADAQQLAVRRESGLTTRFIKRLSWQVCAAATVWSCQNCCFMHCTCCDSMSMQYSRLQQACDPCLPGLAVQQLPV
jgi:hypothetical protein